MSKYYYQVSVTKTSELDNFENGCTGELNDFGILYTLKCKSLNEVLTKIDTKDNYIFDNRIESSVLENENGNDASEFEIALWKQGKLKLWNATYSYYITEVLESEVSNKQLKESFPTLREA